MLHETQRLRPCLREKRRQQDATLQIMQHDFEEKSVRVHQASNQNPSGWHGSRKITRVPLSLRTHKRPPNKRARSLMPRTP